MYELPLEPPEEEPGYECPNCGADLGYGDEVYVNDTDGSVVGCEHCMHRRDAGDALED